MSEERITASQMTIYMRLSEARIWLPMSVMEPGVVYHIHARNALLGIWIPAESGFIIRRTKFEQTSLFVEHHWDTGEPYGTAKPFARVADEPVLDLANAAALRACLDRLDARWPFADQLRLADAGLSALPPRSA